jgi:hypothetical protein
LFHSDKRRRDSFFSDRSFMDRDSNNRVRMRAWAEARKERLVK